MTKGKRKIKIRNMTSNKILLVRLQPRFEEIIRGWVEDRKHDGMTLTRLADMVDMHLSHLSNLINRVDPDDSESPYRRPLSANYVEPFLDEGIFNMTDFYDNAPENEREANWAKSMAYYHETTAGKRILLAAAEASEEGIDIADQVIAFINGIRAGKAKVPPNIIKLIPKDKKSE